MLSTFIKLPFIIKIFALSIFEWPFYTGLTVFLRTKMVSPANDSKIIRKRYHFYPYICILK